MMDIEDTDDNPKAREFKKKTVLSPKLKLVNPYTKLPELNEFKKL
jgi:hypothetical protein